MTRRELIGNTLVALGIGSIGFTAVDSGRSMATISQQLEEEFPNVPMRRIGSRPAGNEYSAEKYPDIDPQLVDQKTARFYELWKAAGAPQIGLKRNDIQFVTAIASLGIAALGAFTRFREGERRIE